MLGCGGEDEVVRLGDGAAARVDAAGRLPESDAVAPRWFPAPLSLAEGAVLTPGPGGRGAQLLGASGGPVLWSVDGAVLSAPAVGGQGRSVVVAHERADGASLTWLVWEGGAWQARTVLDGHDPVDRVGVDASGRRAAFVWAGPEGGVAGVWTVDLAAGQPVRRTNGGPRERGKPPQGFVPLPVGAPVAWDGDALQWTSELGTHRLDLPAGG
jgi:hypothetical protein